MPQLDPLLILKGGYKKIFYHLNEAAGCLVEAGVSSTNRERDSLETQFEILRHAVKERFKERLLAVLEDEVDEDGEEEDEDEDEDHDDKYDYLKLPGEDPKRSLPVPKIKKKKIKKRKYSVDVSDDEDDEDEVNIVPPSHHVDCQDKKCDGECHD